MAPRAEDHCDSSVSYDKNSEVDKINEDALTNETLLALKDEVLPTEIFFKLLLIPTLFSLVLSTRPSRKLNISCLVVLVNTSTRHNNRVLPLHTCST